MGYSFDLHVLLFFHAYRKIRRTLSFLTYSWDRKCKQRICSVLLLYNLLEEFKNISPQAEERVTDTQTESVRGHTNRSGIFIAVLISFFVSLSQQQHMRTQIV